jgi:hypothetical protein
MSAFEAKADITLTRLRLSDACQLRNVVSIQIATPLPEHVGSRPMGIMGLIRWLFGADDAAPSDAMKLDGATEATLARSLSALPPDERGWITFAEARILFSTEGAQYAFGETDRDGRRNIESFAAQQRSIINFMPVEGRVYFVRR